MAHQTPLSWENLHRAARAVLDAYAEKALPESRAHQLHFLAASREEAHKLCSLLKPHALRTTSDINNGRQSFTIHLKDPLPSCRGQLPKLVVECPKAKETERAGFRRLTCSLPAGQRPPDRELPTFRIVYDQKWHEALAA